MKKNFLVKEQLTIPYIAPAKKTNLLVKPFLKWAGGKRQLLPYLRKYVPVKYNNYYEPFIGAGALLFDQQPHSAVINDLNSELINCYYAIKNNPESLISSVTMHENNSEYFYKIRNMDRDGAFRQLSSVERASRIIYLNKTCYNGLFRVNSQGFFNAPFGKYKNPKILDAIIIRAISKFLNNNNVIIMNEDFEIALENASQGDFIYLDPPYDPISETSSFTGYNLDKFDREQQIRLRKAVDKLDSKGCKVLLSNSSTAFIRDLYKDYVIHTINSSRNINSVGSGRGKIDEFLILNYDPNKN